MDSAEERLPISLIVGLVMTGFAMMSWLVRWLTGKATSATTVGMLMLGMCLLMISTWTGPTGAPRGVGPQLIYGELGHVFIRHRWDQEKDENTSWARESGGRRVCCLSLDPCSGG